MPKPPQTSKVVTIAAAHAVHDTYSGFLPPLLPVFIEKFSLAKAEAGLLTVFLQGPSLLQPFIGHIGDRRDLRAAIVLTPTVTAVCMCLLGVTQSYAMTALLLVTAGLSAALLHSVVPVIVGRVSGQRLGFALGFWMVGGELGRTLGPIVLVSAIAVLGLEGLPWLIGGGVGASVLLFSAVRGVSPPRPEKPRRPDLVGAVYSMRHLFVPLTGVVLSRSFMLAAFTTYLPIFLREQGAGLWIAGASLSVVEVGGVAGALVGGSLSDRIGRKRVLVFSLLGSPILMVLFLHITGVGRLPLLLALGFVGLMATPVIMASVQESFPENRTLANGLYMALNLGVRSFIVVLVGILCDRIGMREAFLACAALGLVGTPLIIFLPSAMGSTGKTLRQHDEAD